MIYYFHQNITGNFDKLWQRTIVALVTEGFGVLTEIDVQVTLKKNLNVDSDLIEYWEPVILQVLTELFNGKTISVFSFPVIFLSRK